MKDRPPSFLLVSLDGVGETQLGPITIIGRDRRCEIRCDSTKVSRRHCCLAFDRGAAAVIVRDLAGTNGTRVNGRRIREGCLRHGDELEIADRRFRLIVADPIATEEYTASRSALK